MSYANTALLLPLNGANAGTSFPDFSRHNRTITPIGDAQTSTAQSQFYGSSLLLDGTGDYLRNQDAGIGALGTSLFTFDIWFRPTSMAANSTIFGSRDDAIGPNTFWFLRLQTDGKLVFTVRATSGTGATAIPCNVVTDLAATINVWNHARIARDGTLSISVNGSQAALTGENNTNTYGSSPNGIMIGISTPGSNIDPFTGNMQDFRFMLGTALSTAGAAPDKLIGTLSNTGTGGEPVKDDTGTAAARTLIAVPRSYGAIADNRAFHAVSDGSGNFSLSVPNNAEFSDIDGYSVIALDDNAGTTYNDKIYGRVPTV